MATLKQLRIGLGWTIAKLAQESGMSRQAIAAAEKGGVVRGDTAKAIADALAKGYRKEIKPWEIEGLTIL